MAIIKIQPITIVEDSEWEGEPFELHTRPGFEFPAKLRFPKDQGHTNHRSINFTAIMLKRLIDFLEDAKPHLSEILKYAEEYEEELDRENETEEGTDGKRD